MHTYAFILAGGRGTRLWPLSTARHPKPFMTLFGGRALLAQAVERLQGVVPTDHIYVITSKEFLPATLRALPQLPTANILGEPLARDTAAAVALATGILRQRDPEGTLAIFAADHLIEDEATFRAVLADAYAVATETDRIVTLGIAPTVPATAYGYLECGEPFPTSRQTTFHTVRRFVEKPDEVTAQAYLETGAFLWNAGMFVGQACVMEAAFRKVAPAWVPLIEAPQTLETLYPTLPSSSFDIAVMEQWDRTLVVPLAAGWDDVGSLTALATHFPADAHGNVALARLVAQASKGCTVVDENDHRLTVLLGVEDLVVVQTAEATLICPKAQLAQLKAVVEQLPPEFK